MAWVWNNANIFWCAVNRRKFRLIYSRCIIGIYIQKHANICQTTYVLHPIVLLSLWEVINTSFPFNILFRSFFCLSTYYFESTFISLLFLSTAKAFILCRVCYTGREFSLMNHECQCILCHITFYFPPFTEF